MKLALEATDEAPSAAGTDSHCDAHSEEDAISTTKPRFVASFDELEQKNGQRTRNHLFGCDLTTRARLFRPQIRWLDIDQLSKNHGATRTIAYLKRYAAAQNSHPFGH
jgi:hypothetical protein